MRVLEEYVDDDDESVREVQRSVCKCSRNRMGCLSEIEYRR